MSFTVPENFSTAFAANFTLLSQQRKSRLRQFVKQRGGVVGSSFSVERIAPAEANDVITRHGDTPFQNVVQSRRFADMQDSDWGELVDDFDKIKMIPDPTGDYVQNAVAALNRKQDRVIINAALGAARANTGTVALPAAQIIANGGTGLTLAKLRSAKMLLDDAEMNDEAYFEMMGTGMAQTQPFGNFGGSAYVAAVTSSQIDNMLADTTITSADYNSIKALSAGAINSFMGFWFIRLPKVDGNGNNVLPKSGTVRSAVFYSPKAIEFGIGAEASTEVAKRPDKKFSVQVYAKQSVGAVRAQDNGVVQVDCVES